MEIDTSICTNVFPKTLFEIPPIPGFGIGLGIGLYDYNLFSLFYMY